MKKKTSCVVLSLGLGLVGCSVEAGAVDEPQGRVEQAVRDDCVDPPVRTPQSCIDRDRLCGWGSVVFVAQEVLAQGIPGCGPRELATTLVVDGLSTDWEQPEEATAVWACNVLACSASSDPRVVAAQAACASGTALASYLRCLTAQRECETDLRNAQPVSCEGIEADYPCPYRPTVAACSGGAPRSEGEISADCARVVGSYPDVSGPTEGQCMARCVRDTIENGASCGGAAPGSIPGEPR